MGKAIMFMMFVWVVTCIADSVMQGHVDFVRTRLITAIDDDDTTIRVSSTNGFSDSGIIVIEDERIAYSERTSTTFEGSPVRPLVRGAEGTDNVSHSAGVQVSTVPGAMLNSSASYSIAVMTDPSGALAFISMPLAFFTLLGSFFFLPLQFFGTDLQIITYIWATVAVGVLVAATLAIVGGRRV